MKNNTQKSSNFKNLFLLTIILFFSTPSFTQCWSTLDAGEYRVHAIRTNGTLWAWGGYNGSLGNGCQCSSNIPIQIGTDANWNFISDGEYHFAVIKTNGTLWTSGSNNVGQLGNGTFGSINHNLNQVGTSTNWFYVEAGYESTTAIKTDGTLWAWGKNNFGQLGDGTNTNRNTPFQIGTATNWKNISSNKHTLALKINGTLWAWGNNSFGQLGDNTLINKNQPVQIGSSVDWKTIAVGYEHSMAIKNNGTLWAWGLNSYGQLGDNTLVNKKQPIQIGTENNWLKIAAGNNFSYAIKTDGTLWTWGINNSGQLGDGTFVNKNFPVQIGTDTNWTHVTCGETGAAARKNDGTIWTCGGNAIGFLGIGPMSGSNNSNIQVSVITSNCIFPIVGNNDSGTSINGIGSVEVTNVLNNDTYNSLPATSSNVNLSLVSSTNTGITLNTTTGGVAVAANVPVGTYTLIYQICATASSSTCTNGTVTITVLPPVLVANPDSATTTFGVASTPIGNVRANDTYNGAVATSSNTTLSFVSSTNTDITLNTTTGAISVSASVPAGTYTLTYQICATSSPTTCVNGTVTITVSGSVNILDAINDSASTVVGIASTILQNIRVNDTFNNLQANSSNTNLTLVSSTNSGITLNTTSGAVNINGLVPVGTYYLVYQLCEYGSTVNCDNATITIVVFPQTPTSVAGIRADNTVKRIDLQSNGKIIITGYFTKYNNIDSKFIARLNTDLTLDQTFSSTSINNGPPEDFLIQPDDKILIVNYADNAYNSFSEGGIVRLDANGAVDTNFNVGGSGIGLGEYLTACALQPDGKILIGGNYLRSYNGAPVEVMIRLNQDGSIDNTFHFPYINYEYNSQSAGISKILIQPDGKIIVGGTNSLLVEGQPSVFRLNPDGSIDNTFTKGYTGAVTYNGQNCSSCLSAIQNITLQPDNKIIISGAFNTYNLSDYKNIVRLNSDGSIDTSFNAGTSTNRVIKDVELDLSTGKIYIGGEFSTYNNMSVNKIIRLNADGSVDATFNSGTGTSHTMFGAVYNNVQAIKKQGDGKLIIGGSFKKYNGIDASNITRLQPAVPGGQAKSQVEYWESESEIDINGLAINNNIFAYPNPSNGIFNIDLSDSNSFFNKITIYNFLGEEVYRNNIVSGNNNQIDISSLPSGYYFARIFNPEKSVQLKLIKR